MPGDKRTILLIEDEKDILSILTKYLSDEGYWVCALSDGRTAAAEAAKDDYVTKPFDIRELLARIETALHRRKQYEEISMRDALTGLPNVHFFKRELAAAFDMAKRYGRIFTVGFMDIDRFKAINDRFGHLTGDCVLRETAKRMGMSVRNPDVLARYGGDEFCMIMREATEDKAQIALGRLKRSVEKNLFQGHNGDGKFPVSISVGSVPYRDKFSSAEELLALADADMYRSKRRLPDV